MTTEEFIQKAKAIHGDKYDYSKVEYVNAKTKVCIICSRHGEFLQRPSEHLRGYGCFACGHEYVVQLRKKTKEWFIENAQKVHGIQYDYSKVDFINVTTKVCIVCPIHGEFWQTPHSHIQGTGCPECSRLRAANLRKRTNEEFIEDARKIHGDKYDYSKVQYKDVRTPVTIICPKHGEFCQTPDSHLQGAGCSKCSHERIGEMSRSSKEWFLTKAHEVHGDRYDYSKVDYRGSSVKICIICKEHGEFWQAPNIHIKGHGCPLCAIEQNTKYTKEQCLEAAKKCNSRVEFYKKYQPLSLAAQYHGWYEECCAHMGRRGNKQRIIYAYEFESSHAAYIGLTFNMEVRNKRHHKEGAVFDFAQLHHIDIPQPKILTDYMSQEEASIQEGVWLQKYKDAGWIILNRFKTGSLGGQEMLDYDISKIKKSMQGFDKFDSWAKSYSSYREYIRQHQLEYILDQYFPNRQRRIYDNFNVCKEAYLRCNNIAEVHKKYPGAIAAAKRHGWHEELAKLCADAAIQRKQETIKEVIKGYKTLKDFRHDHRLEYNYIRNKRWYDLLAPLKRQLHPDYHFTIEQIKALCQEAGTYEVLKANHPEILNYCWHHSIDLYAMNGWTRSNRRPIRLLRNGKVVATFSSTIEAAKYFGMGNRHLGRYIDKNIEYHGYMWETDK